MGDITLVADAILNLVESDTIISPFDPMRLKGASYDLAVGRTIVALNSDGHGNLSAIDLEVQRVFLLPPGKAIVVYSLEYLKVPRNIKGRISLRASLSARLLSMSGGLLDPGYEGYLFLPLANIGEVPIEIKYASPIASLELVKLDVPTRGYPGGPLRTIPPERLPEASDDEILDIGVLSILVRSLEHQVAAFSEVLKLQGPKVEATQRIVDTVLLGSLAGTLAAVMAGAATAVVLIVGVDSGSVALAVAAVIALAGSVAVGVVRWASRPKG